MELDNSYTSAYLLSDHIALGLLNDSITCSLYKFLGLGFLYHSTSRISSVASLSLPMEPSLVIKVKYGETLRRFNSGIVDGKLALDMNELREKVLSLFSFPAGSELAFTYVDEDGDVVTLADEEDLRDVVRQSLNPLRVTVKLNVEKGASSQSRSSGNSTPLRSPRIQPPLQVLSSSVSEILNSVPEAVRESFLRMSIDSRSSTTPTPQVFPEILDTLARMCLTYLKEASVPSAESGPSGGQADAPVTGDKNSSVAVGTTQVTELKSIGGDQGGKTGSSEGSAISATDNENLKDKPSVGNLVANTAPSSFDVTVGHKQYEANKVHGVHVEEGNGVASKVFSGDVTKEVKKSNVTPQGSKSVMNPGSSNPPIWMNSYLSGVMSKKHTPTIRGDLPHRAVSFKGSYNHTGRRGSAFRSTFHSGVRCDGCGVHPITGPRFKSKVKENYDLCSICFADMGCETEYIRFDIPMSYSHPVPIKGFYDPMQSYLGHRQTFPAGPSKLDSRFIQDVNVLDGTIMAPSTPFTKIWRMRNSGTVDWPQGTHLQWIGGERFSKMLSCDLEIPADGFTVDKVIDIAVDFVAPVRPGRYVSYWRMASPSGHKFGQRVWVLIQVDASSEDSLSQNTHGFNLNFPPVSTGMMDSRTEYVSLQPEIEGICTETSNLNKVTEPMEQVGDAPSSEAHEHNFPINDTLMRSANPNIVTVEASSPITYPAIDISSVEPIATSPAQTSDMIQPSSANGVGENNEVEQVLLNDLEDMGFNQADLNKEILRRNDYNLEQSINELCGLFEGWDPMLQELQEMGFSDHRLNKMLLKKNNGSIKRVVMDLIAGERA